MAIDDLSSSITVAAARRESRRSFLRQGALAALAGTALAACKPTKAAQTSETSAPPSPPTGATGTDAYTATANVATSTARAAADDDGQDARGGDEGVPREDLGQGERAPRANHGWQREGLFPHRAQGTSGRRSRGIWSRHGRTTTRFQVRRSEWSKVIVFASSCTTSCPNRLSSISTGSS